MAKFLRIIGIACVFFVSDQVRAEENSATASGQFRQRNAPRILQEFKTFAEIPNVSANREDALNNAKYLVDALKRREIDARLWELEGANPVVYGSVMVPGAKHTVVLYAHYDGMPTGRESDWHSNPFTPTLRSGRLDQGGQDIPWPASAQSVDPEWRIYARGSADDKAPIQAMLSAYDAVRASGVKLTSNLKFVFEGEEEAGSTNLRKHLEAHKAELASDIWIFCDSPVHRTGRHQIVFGCRGLIRFDIVTYGAKRTLHSGHFGTWAPDPAARLSHLLASMRTIDGVVTIPGINETTVPLSPAELAEVEKLPTIDELVEDELDLPRGSSPIQYNQLPYTPTLTITQFATDVPISRGSDGTDNYPTVVPSRANAVFELRLANGNSCDKVESLIKSHLEKLGYLVVDADPDAALRKKHAKIVKLKRRDSTEAYRASLDNEVAQSVAKAVEKAATGGLLRVPSMGATLPLAEIYSVFNCPIIIVPTVNADNNQHSPDENLRIGNLWYAIDVMTELYTVDWEKSKI